MKWTTHEMTVRRLARRADLTLARKVDQDGEIAYQLFDRRTRRPLQPERLMSLEEAWDECAMRNR